VLSTVLRALREPRSAGKEQVIVKADGRHVFLTPDEILWIEATRKDARLHLAGGTLDVRESMSSLESRLDPGVFVRVHRSTIVNRSQIREIQPWFKGDYVLILRKGTRIVSGRTYRSAVQQLLQR
jgi:two-component system LytT family response regulator